MKIHKGNLEIKAGDKTDYSKLEKITGYLYIKSNAELKNLKSVGGYLYIKSNAELKNLKSVGGYLYIKSNAELKAPNLKSVGGDLSINSNAELKNLKSVGGDLSIYSNAELKAPDLKSVGGYLYIKSNAELKNLKSVGGYLYIKSNAELKAPNLKSVGGDLYINSKISIDLAKNLWGANRKDTKKEWYINNQVPEWLIERVSTLKNTEYRINNVSFNLEWFNKIRKDELTPDEVFAIDNVEHRRVAYELMDKSKMKLLKDYKVLDEVKDDGYGNPMRVVSFTVQNMKEPLKFYNCYCPSTKREYYLGTNKDKCIDAKASLAGFEADEIEFIKEW